MAYRASPFEVVVKALKDSARTHHMVRRMGTQPGPELHASDANWQYCMASSCSIAFSALVEAKVFGERELAIRQRRKAKLLAKARL